MIVDCHVHTACSHDSGMDPARLLDTARQRGLDAIVVCDHDDVSGALHAADIAEQTGSPVRVIIAEEVKTTEGEIIGLFLSGQIPGGLTPEQTVAHIREQGGLVCVPHPFDRFRSSPLTAEALARIEGDIDLVEISNGRNLLGADDRAAREWASARGKAVTAGSDAHTYGEVGAVFLELDAFDSAEEFLAAAGEARPRGRRTGPGVHVLTAIRKRLARRA